MADSMSNRDNSETPAGPIPLSITVDRGNGVTTLLVRGEIDLETSGDLSAALAEARGSGNVRVDLGDVTYMDSTGLRALLVAKDEVEHDGGSLRVTAASNIVTRLIEITGVDDLLG